MKIVGVSGLPLTGKTTVARWIARAMPRAVCVNFQAPVITDAGPIRLKGEQLITKRFEGAQLLLINHHVVVFDNVLTFAEAQAIDQEGGLIVSVTSSKRGTNLPIIGNSAKRIERELAMAVIHNDATIETLQRMTVDLVHSQGLFERLVDKETARKAIDQ